MSRNEALQQQAFPQLESGMQNGSTQENSHHSQFMPDQQFSALFPAHLYLNRNENPVQESNLQYDLTSDPFIGRDQGEEAYDRMPIEAFGKSILGKFGWKEGGEVGRQKGAIIEPIEYVPRQHRLGLGAKPLSKEQIKKIGRDDRDFDRRKLAVTDDYQTQEGQGKNFKSIHSKLVKKEVMKVGSLIQIQGGSHDGMQGKIVAIVDPKSQKKLQQQIMGDEVSDEIDGDALTAIELVLNGQIVNAKRKRLILISSRNAPVSELEAPTGKRKTSRSRSREDEKKGKRLKWVAPGIIVRIISKKVYGGKYYNQKARITDVLDRYKFLAQPIENGIEMLDNLTEKDIETVIPKDLNCSVLILRGEFKGEIGTIMSKDRKKDEVVIQVGMTDITKVSQDDCCQRAE